MISDPDYKEAYVWVWLPGKTQPVVAGRISKAGDRLVFNYGRSYLERDGAIPLHLPELPLRQGLIEPLTGLRMAGCLRDASPDAWGRRVILNRKLGVRGQAAETADLAELTYMLESSSDRAGALDFQRSPTEYVARETGQASLQELVEAAAWIEQGLPLPATLGAALQHGTSLGGARPKASIEDGRHKYIAKFSSTTDTYNVVKAEYAAMRLAALVGLDVAPVTLARSLDKDVLLVRRFDRTWSAMGWLRHAMVSALTLLELDEMAARYASYEKLAEIARHRFVEPVAALRELFARMAFNVLCGNTDDHARNHAAFWDGHVLRLTPAYDICPQNRTGGEASQGMIIHSGNRLSRVAVCIDAAAAFLLGVTEATEIVRAQIAGIQANWSSVCDEAELPAIERAFLWQRQFLNPYALEGVQ